MPPTWLRSIDRYVQNIQKNPMVTVAEAASALGIDERTVREKLSKEEWKGEKRLIGMKEKWFMYRGELDRQVERLRIMRPQERVSTVGLDSVFDADEAHTIDAQTVEVEHAPRNTDNISIAVNEVISKLAEEFSRQLSVEKEAVFTLRKELEERERQLRLLPDVQKQAEEQRQSAELKELEAVALRKQVEALEIEKATVAEEFQQLKSEKELQENAVQEQLRVLTCTVQQLQQPWWKKWFAAGESEGR